MINTRARRSRTLDLSVRVVEDSIAVILVRLCARSLPIERAVGIPRGKRARQRCSDATRSRFVKTGFA